MLACVLDYAARTSCRDVPHLMRVAMDATDIATESEGHGCGRLGGEGQSGGAKGRYIDPRTGAFSVDTFSILGGTDAAQLE